MKNFLYIILTAAFFWLTAGFINVYAQSPVIVNIDVSKKAQTIQNFGASGCWYSEAVGLYWPDSVKEKMAELLFSKETGVNGSPKGIGLSAWRFNIGAGTAEQGDSSGIKMHPRRVECFLNADGTYNWNRQQGYLWFTEKARDYGVENLIAFVNSPPVFFTKNGLGYKTVKDGHTNLKDNYYKPYAAFLATVLAHFDEQKLHFNMVSPVNEPQWDWYDKYGEGSQEGSPYTNREIYRVVNALDSALTEKKLTTRILVPEAGTLNFLFDWTKTPEKGGEVQQFWAANSPLYVGNLKHPERVVAAHSYFTDTSENDIISTRQKLADTVEKYKVGYWETEYSMLGKGYKEGSKEKRSGFDCAMFLAKLIHHDLTDGNASAWQFWNAWEPGNAEFETRYYLLALHPSADFKSGTFAVTKNLWALGNYSRFIRPGMVRIKLAPVEDKDILISAWYGFKKMVVVIINNSPDSKAVKLNFAGGKFSKTFKPYVTTAKNSDNLTLYPAGKLKEGVAVQARSIYTIVTDGK
jgi:O-glycosyl hydrolase